MCSSTRPRCPAGGSAPRPRVRRLAPRRGRALVAGAAARPARRVRVALRVASAFAVLGRAPRRAARAGGRGARRGLPRARAYWLDDWARSRATARSRSRCGSTRVGRAPRLRGRARRPADRRRPDLRRAGRLRPCGAPGALPAARRGRGRRAAGPAQPRRPAVGQPALRLDGARRAPASAGGSSACAGRVELADRYRIDHFRGFAAYWAVPAGAASARDGTVAPRDRVALSSTPRGTSSARCR